VKARPKIWRIGWRLAVCGILLLWIFHNIFLNEGRLAGERQGLAWDSLSRLDQWKTGWFYGPRELWRTLRIVNPASFAAALGFMGLTVVLGAVRWHMVLLVQGLALPMGRTLAISMVAQLFNAFLLGSTGGDVLRAYYAARETHHKKTEAVVTVVVDRLIGLFSMLLFACVLVAPNLPLLWARHWANQRLIALTVFVLAMMLACSVVVVLAFWGGVSRRWPNARAWLQRLPKGDLLERSIDASRRFGREPWFLGKVTALSMGLNVFSILPFVILARGMGLSVPVLPLFAIVPMIICVSALPITPSGLGVRESLFVIMLAIPEIHIEATKALSLSLLGYSVFLFWSLVGGVVYFCLKDREHLSEVAQVENAVENG
jgi:glycosyltransferase 2 family protein